MTPPALPRAPRPIVLIGAGGIVCDAHLPTYTKAGFTVGPLVDPVPGRARAPHDAHGVVRLYRRVAEAVAAAPADAVFDLVPRCLIGFMAVPQRCAEGSLDLLPISVEDVLRTTAVVDAAHRSAEAVGEPPPYGA